MKGRIRIAAAGLVVMTVLTAMTATARRAGHAGRGAQRHDRAHRRVLVGQPADHPPRGMGLAGALLIGRRRIVAVARSINPLTRRRASQ
jgi:hypothetical protein